MEKYDLVIIGGGVGGLVSASGAAQLGAKVALVEKKSLGGDCLHYGCVPTKRFLYSAKAFNMVRKAGIFGLDGESLKVNFEKVVQGVRDVQEKIGKHDDPERFRKMGVNVIFASGKFIDSHTFEINGQKLYGRKFIIATGTRPAVLPISGLNEAGAINNITALELKKLPESIAILGAGHIGIEYAQIFNRLGSKVIVMEKMGQILPREDKELSEGLHNILVREGAEIHTCTEVKGIKREGDKKSISAACSEGESLYAVDEIMAAIGRVPNTEGLNLESAAVNYNKMGIPVDKTMRTNIKHIYAIGDVTGGMAFTHVAEYQAGIAISNALFPFFKRKAEYRVVPWVTYTDPELARVGLTEDEAKEKYGNRDIRVFRFYFRDIDRAIIEGETEGLIKLICDKKNLILGAHILGPHAGELIHEYCLAMKANIPITKISRTIHAYPTLSQSVKRACDQYYREKLFKGVFPKITRWLINLQRNL
ncbi:MAG TPA: dihydrolipoyl dehydrogenase [Deltaproteobacteria bacterium]|nr:dihydrolipoyl dehydrogenase [Deltaproteobacteria bacterium]